MSRKKNQSITDWGEEHKTHVTEWNQRNFRKDGERRVTDWNTYEGEHMRWYDDARKHRLRLRPQWTTEDIAELERDDPEEEAYQTDLRDMHSGFREFAPLINRVVSLNRRLYLNYFIRHRD
jgi:hypothetical protein